MTQGPWNFKITAVGPADHLPEPSVGSVVIGRLTTGPIPQVTDDSFAGEKKLEKTMSPQPEWIRETRADSRRA